LLVCVLCHIPKLYQNGIRQAAGFHF
jgi:hypothetical protein